MMPELYKYKKKFKKGIIITCCSVLTLLSFVVVFSMGKVSSVDAAITNTINFQSKVVIKTSGLNVTTGTPACVKSGADTCDFQIRVWNHITNTSTTSGTGNLMFTQTFQDVEIGDNNGIFNLVINSCGSSVSGNSQWGTTTGTCTAVDDSDSDSDPGVNFDRNDLYFELGFAPADTSGSLGTFSELFSRIQSKSVPSAFAAQTLSGLTKDGFVQLTPSSTQTVTSTNSLINLTTTANTSNSLILINENGAGTPNLLNLQVAGTSKFLVTNSGSLGIGTTTPDVALDIVGNFQIGDAETATKSYRFKTDSSQLDIDAAAADLYISTWSGANYTGTQYIQAVYSKDGYPMSLFRGIELRNDSWQSQISFSNGGSAVFNEQGNDSDHRIESDNNINMFLLDASADGIGIADATSTAFLNIAGSTTSKASLRLISSSGTNPSSPNSGDLWWNGTNLNFRTSSTTVDILTLGAIADDSLDFNKFEDTLDLDANLVLNQTTNTWSQTFTGTTTGLTYTADSLTSGGAVALASSATALTGNLQSITLSGSNAANTGSLLYLNNTGTANTNTSLLIQHNATGTNNLAFRVNDVASDTTPFVVDGAGQVGIGTSAPLAALDVYSTARISSSTSIYTNLTQGGDNIFAISGTGAAFRVESPNANTEKSFYFQNYAGTVGNSYFFRIANDNSFGINNNFDNASGADYDLRMASYGSASIRIDANNDETDRSFQITTNGSTALTTLTENGNFAIGSDTSPDYLLELGTSSSSDPSFALSDGDVAHGLTTLAETDVLFHLVPLSSTAGGAQMTAISDANAQAFLLRGIIGSTDPTDTTAAIKIVGAKSNGSTGMADLAAAETVFQVANNDDAAAITVLGNGNVGIGTSTPTDFKLQVNGNIGPDSAPTTTTVSQTITNLDTANTVGQYSSIAMGLDGLPIIAYYDVGGGNLKTIKCGDIGCTTGNTTSTVESTNDVGKFPSIVVPADGLPFIAYFDETNDDLRTAKCANAACSTTYTITAIDTTNETGKMPDVAIASDGLPIIVYYENIAADVRVTKCGNASCSSGNTTTAVVTSGSTYSSSIAVPADGRPVIAYFIGGGTDDLGFVKCGNASCSSGNTTSTVYSTGAAGSEPSIAIHYDGFPIISHRTGGNIAVTKCGNNGCSANNTTTEFSTGDNDGAASQIMIPGDRLPVIAHNDYGGGNLNVFKCTNLNCTTGAEFDVDDSTVSTDTYIGMILDVNDFPIISYFDDSPDDLAVVRCAVDDCTITTGGMIYTGGSDLGSIAKFFKNVYAANYSGKSINISNFDLAEEYEVEDSTIQAGEVVRFKKSSSSKLTVERTTRDYDDDAIGVVSTEPGLYLKDWQENKQNGRPVALAGRVPVKVTNENGEIKRGDYLTASSRPGFAMKAVKGGLIIGRAMEDFTYIGGDSQMVSQELEKDETEAKKLVEELAQSGSIQNGAVEEAKDLIDQVTRPVGEGRIMMFVQLGEIADGFFEKKLEINSAIKITQFSAENADSLFEVTDSKLILKRNLDVQGEVSAQRYTAPSANDLLIQINNSKLFRIITADGSSIFSIDASGKLTIKEAPGSSIGQATLQAGQSEVKILNSTVTESSRIQITPNQFVSYRIKSKEPSTGFTIEITAPVEVDVKFDYWIIN
jgi:hypothetical protein